MNNNSENKINTRSIIFSIVIVALLSIPIIEDVISSSLISTSAFIGKDKMLSLVNSVKYFIFKDKYYSDTIIDRNNWVMYTDTVSLDDYQNADPYTSNELDSVKIRLDQLCYELTKSGIKLIVMVPPNKNTVYSEYMPLEIPKLKEQSRLDQVMNIWNDTENCKIMDLRSTLILEKNNSKTYWATDTHWSQYGAFLTAQELTKMMHADFSSVKMRALSDYKMVPDVYTGDLSLRIAHLKIDENVFLLNPTFHPNYILRNYEASKDITNLMESYSNDKTLPKAIIYRDSFFIALLPFIAENFSEAEYIWSNIIDMDLVKTKKPDYLIFEVTERYITNRFFNLPLPK